MLPAAISKAVSTGGLTPGSSLAAKRVQRERTARRGWPGDSVENERSNWQGHNCEQRPWQVSNPAKRQRGTGQATVQPQEARQNRQGKIQRARLGGSSLCSKKAAGRQRRTLTRKSAMNRIICNDGPVTPRATSQGTRGEYVAIYAQHRTKKQVCTAPMRTAGSEEIETSCNRMPAIPESA